MFISAITCFPLGLYLSHWYELNSTHWIIVQVLVGVMILQLVSIAMQPTSKTPVAFKVKQLPTYLTNNNNYHNSINVQL